MQFFYRIVAILATKTQVDGISAQPLSIRKAAVTLKYINPSRFYEGQINQVNLSAYMFSKLFLHRYNICFGQISLYQHYFLEFVVFLLKKGSKANRMRRKTA
jgi:hypothetical protein